MHSVWSVQHSVATLVLIQMLNSVSTVIGDNLVDYVLITG